MGCGEGDKGCTQHISLSPFEEHRVPHTEVLYQVLSLAPILFSMGSSPSPTGIWLLLKPWQLLNENSGSENTCSGVWRGEGLPQKANTQSFRMLRQGDAHLSAWPACCRGVHPNTSGCPSPHLAWGFQSNCTSRSCSVPSCNWTFDIQKVPHCQTQKNTNFQAVHTISVEHIFIIVIGSCREVRSQEAEKRNQIFEGLTGIRRVAIGLLKQKKQIP